MKFYTFILTFVVVTGFSNHIMAQNDTLQIEKKRASKIQGYIAGVYERAPVSSDHTNSFGIQVAVILKNHWQLGFYNSKYGSDNYQQQLIFPNVFQMNYKHAGFLLGYRTHLEKKYEFNLESKLGFGEVKWDQVESGSAFLADKFKLFHLQAGADYMLTNFLALNTFLGYRWMSGLEITGLTNEDFNGLYFGVGLKVGLFR